METPEYNQERKIYETTIYLKVDNLTHMTEGEIRGDNAFLNHLFSSGKYDLALAAVDCKAEEMKVMPQGAEMDPDFKNSPIEFFSNQLKVFENYVGSHDGALPGPVPFRPQWGLRSLHYRALLGRIYVVRLILWYKRRD